MAFEFDKLPREAQKAAFANMRAKGTLRDAGKGAGKSDTPKKTGAAGKKMSAGKGDKAAAADQPRSVEGRIASAYEKLARSPGSWVGMADLRRELSGVDRETQDKVLKDLSRTGQAFIVPESNRKALRPEDHAAAIRIGGEDNHILQISARALAGLKPAAASSGAANKKMSAAKKPGGRASSRIAKANATRRRSK